VHGPEAHGIKFVGIPQDLILIIKRA